MAFFCIPFIVLYLLSHVKIVVCICMYSILNKILFTLKRHIYVHIKAVGFTVLVLCILSDNALYLYQVLLKYLKEFQSY